MRGHTQIAACLMASLFASTASAQLLSDTLLRIEASATVSGDKAVETGAFEVGINDATFDRDTNTWSWELSGPADIMTQDGLVLATLVPSSGNNSTSFVYQVPAGGDADKSTPVWQANLGFAVIANPNVDTDFTIKSALIDVNPDLATAQGRASAAISLTDVAGGAGATLTGLNAGGGSYVAQYNGLVPAGVTFTEGINNIATGSTTTTPFNFPAAPNTFSPIAGTVQDLSTQVSFRLSAGDIASGTTNFIVIPEPASALLLGVLGLIVRRR